MSYWPSKEVGELATVMADAIDGAGWALGLSDDEYALIAQAVIDGGWVRNKPTTVPCIDCGGNDVDGPDDEEFMDCRACGAAWIPGKGEKWHISTGASLPPTHRTPEYEESWTDASDDRVCDEHQRGTA